MKKEPDALPSIRSKTKFMPKIPPRKTSKTIIPKSEPVENNVDVLDQTLLEMVNKGSQVAKFKRPVRLEKRLAPSQVAFGHGGSVGMPMTFGFPNKDTFIRKLEEGQDVCDVKVEKEYVEPWDYAHSYYPVALPLRMPYSGDPVILDEVEFREVAASRSLESDGNSIKLAKELGLMEKSVEAQMIYFQLPASLPLAKKNEADVKNKEGNNSKKGCNLAELPSGLMGKILVYKSGAVKMKIGDSLYDVSTGANSIYAQDVAAINTKEKQFCILGELNRRAILTPDVDYLLDSTSETKW